MITNENACLKYAPGMYCNTTGAASETGWCIAILISKKKPLEHRKCRYFVEKYMWDCKMMWLQNWHSCRDVLWCHAYFESGIEFCVCCATKMWSCFFVDLCYESLYYISGASSQTLIYGVTGNICPQDLTVSVPLTNELNILILSFYRFVLWRLLLYHWCKFPNPYLRCVW